MGRKTAYAFVLLVLARVTASGGQSLVLQPGVVSSSVADPDLPARQPWRVEFQMHNWADPKLAGTNSGYVWDFNGIGASAAIISGGYLRITDKRDSTAGSCCDLPILGLKNILVRIQRDPAKLRFVCEVWNYDGTAYQQRSVQITSFSDWGYSDGRFGSEYTTAAIGFFRIFSTILPDGSPPPATAAIGNLTNLKFDGTTTDSSGKRHHARFAAAQFQETPGQIAVAIIKTAGSPSWSNWVSLRAGYPATLDATDSFSLADASSAVSWRWQQVSGPTRLRWSDSSAAKPIIAGLVFGTYRLRLEVTDSTGASASTELDVGAVATDDNGVVINANPAADLIFGPMIAFGKNPWPWQDQIALHSATVRKRYIDAISPPGWGSNLKGSISYLPGATAQTRQTRLAVAVSPADTALSVIDPTTLDLSSLPTVLMLHASNTIRPIEEVRICSVSGKVLHVCYDGRGWRMGLYERVAAPQRWPVGTSVRQVRTMGTGTAFLTDFCPAGPGEGGFVSYSKGKIAVTPGSQSLTGTGTAWDSTVESHRIRIRGAHGGQPFVFFATISSILGNTSIRMSRPWPQDADAGTSLDYAILESPRYIARGWKRPDGTKGRQVEGVSSCESDTSMFNVEILSNVIGPQTGQPYGYSDFTWFSEFGPNYYDEVLAHYAGYFRSGYSLFLENARKIGDFLPGSPDFDEGWLPQIPRHTGATGMFAAAVLDGRAANWYTLRRLASSSVANLPNLTCDSDTREGAYSLSWLALAALFDPVDNGSATEPNQRSYWKARLADAFKYDNNCKGQHNEFPQAYYNGANGAFGMTHGSAMASGHAIPPALCNVSATGTVIVTKGSTAASGTGFASDQKIVIKARKAGKYYLFFSQFRVNSPQSVTMASPFDGDSGTYSYQTESDLSWLAFASSISDHTNLNSFYVCQWVNPTTIMLDREWEGATGTFNATRGVDVGYGQTVFLTGIKAIAMKWASMAASGPTSKGYGALADATASWILTSGFDSVTSGLYYKRYFSGCEPVLNPRMNCMYGADPAGKEAARMLSAEAQNAMRMAYEANPTAQNKLFGDQLYGAQWGKLGGPWSDSVYLSALDVDAAFSYKWIGFLFGMGMSHQWPAVRLGGVQPPIILNPSISSDLASHPGATSVQITVTEPSGAVKQYNCSTASCQVTVDARQGTAWYQVNYLNAQGAVLDRGNPDLLQADIRR